MKTKHFISIMLIAVMIFPMTVNAVSAPAQVKTLTATTYSNTSVRLTWKKPGKNSGYAIYVNGKLNRRVSNKTLAYNVPNLKAATTYKFQVRAYNTYKQKQYYNSKTKKWQTKKPAKKYWKGKKTRTVIAYKYGKISPTRSAITGPAKITGLKSTAKTYNTITIQWTKQTNALTGYIVYKNNVYYKTLGKNTNALKVTGLAANTAYTYKVRSYFKVGSKNIYGTWSDNLKVTTATKPVAAKKTQTIIANDKTVRAGYTVNIGASVSSKLPLTYSTSNSSIATVNSNGVITGKKAGTAIITIKQAGNASYNATTKTIRVTVIADTNTGNSSDNNTGNNNSNSNSSNNSNTNSNTGNNNNNNTSNAVAYKAFKVLESTSVINIRDNGTIKVQLPANNFTVTWSSSDNDCISVQGSGNTATLTAKKKYGESIKITAKLNVPSGSTYTGKTEVSIYVTNTVFPRDADGKYTLTSDGKYWYCGGIKCDYNFYTITDVLPNNTTFKVNINNINNKTIQ